MRENPFDELERLLDRVGRQVEEGMNRGTGFPVPGTVPVDVVDADEEFVVTADLPGYETDDIDLTLSDGALHLEASREAESEVESDRYLRRERRRRTVDRRIRLPEPVDEGEVSATFEDGILTVHLPKVGGGEDARRIDID